MRSSGFLFFPGNGGKGASSLSGCTGLLSDPTANPASLTTSLLVPSVLSLLWTATISFRDFPVGPLASSRTCPSLQVFSFLAQEFLMASGLSQNKSQTCKAFLMRPGVLLILCPHLLLLAFAHVPPGTLGSFPPLSSPSRCCSNVMRLGRHVVGPQSTFAK